MGISDATFGSDLAKKSSEQLILSSTGGAMTV